MRFIHTSGMGSSRRAIAPLTACAAAAFIFAFATASPAAVRTWNNGSGDFAWNATSLNWSGTPATWAPGDDAVFSTTGVGTVTVVPVGIVARTISFNTAGYTVSGGTIALNTGGITQIVASQDAVINSNLSKTGSGLFWATAAAGKTLTFNGNIDATSADVFHLQGAGSYIINGSIGANYTNFLLSSGTTTVTFTTANSFTGTLHLLTAGGAKTLNFSDVNQLGTGTGGNFIAVQGGSTLRYTGTGSQGTTARDIYWNSGAATIDITSATGNLTLNSTGGGRNQAFTKAGAGTLTIAAVNANAADITGTMNLTGGTMAFLSENANAATWSGVISGSGAIVRTGTGTGVLTLSAANTYTGTTTINAGTLRAGAAAGGTAFGNLSAVTIANVAGATLDLNGFSQTIGSLAGGGGAGGNVTLGAATLTTGGNNTSTSYAGVISGTGGLVKTGTGTQTLSGANTYEGGTTVSGGTLLVNNISGSGTGSGTVSVAAGATLGGSGTIAGATTISGTHSPGDSPGIQTFGADLSYTTDSKVVWELIDNTTAGRGVDFDGIDVTGDLNFTGPTTLDLVFNLGSTVDWFDSFWGNNYFGTDGWLLYQVDGTTTNFENLSITPDNWEDGNGTPYNAAPWGKHFALYHDLGSNNIYLTSTPEPTKSVLLAIGLISLTARRRR